VQHVIGVCAGAKIAEGECPFRRIRDALAGLKGVELRLSDLAVALGTTPATVEEIKERFEEFIESLTKGADTGKVRFLIRP
jgi:hypothetical protein